MSSPPQFVDSAGRRNTLMTRSVRLYTAAQFEEVKTLVDVVAERSDLPTAERDRLTAFQADLQQTVREDRRRATGAARLQVSSSCPPS
jgi:hypothetical protein